MSHSKTMDLGLQHDLTIKALATASRFWGSWNWKPGVVENKSCWLIRDKLMEQVEWLCSCLTGCISCEPDLWEGSLRKTYRKSGQLRGKSSFCMMAKLTSFNAHNKQTSEGKLHSYMGWNQPVCDVLKYAKSSSNWFFLLKLIVSNRGGIMIVAPKTQVAEILESFDLQQQRGLTNQGDTLAAIGCWKTELACTSGPGRQINPVEQGEWTLAQPG